MPAKSSFAPGTTTACQVDLADNTFADKRLCVRLNNLAYELMSWRS
jgi:hypothetical protein